MLHDLITKYKTECREHTELRAQENLNCVVMLKDGKMINNINNSNSGVFSRVYKGGVYGASSSADYSDKSIRKVLQESERIAVKADKRIKLGEAPLPHIPYGSLQLNRLLKPLDQNSHIDFAFAIDQYIATKYPDLKSREVRVRSQSTEKHLTVTDGWDAHTAVIRCYVDVGLYTEAADGSIIDLNNYFGKSCYIDEAFADFHWLYNEIDILYHDLMKRKEGIFPNAGLHDIILCSGLSGMLAHEAVGHTVEADMVLAGSIAGSYIGKQVASPIVNLLDYANTVSGKHAPLGVYVDDEGSPAEDAVIIKDGVLQDFLNSRQTARNFGGKAAGNIRASGYMDEPMVRMRNTAFAPGTSKFEDMVASIDDGYCLIYNENGQGDRNGEFMIAASFGYEIKNGKFARPIKGTTISGIAFEMLKTIDMVSDEIGWRFGGVCGKKQTIEVAMGGPAIKCKAVMAGR